MLQPLGNIEWQTKNALKVIFASKDLFLVYSIVRIHENNNNDNINKIINNDYTDVTHLKFEKEIIVKCLG